MASSASYTVGDTTPVLVFSGSGNFVLRADGAIYLGGPGVTAANGHFVTVATVSMNVNSPDEIYALATVGTTRTVTVLSVR